MRSKLIRTVNALYDASFVAKYKNDNGDKAFIYLPLKVGSDASELRYKNLTRNNYLSNRVIINGDSVYNGIEEYFSSNNLQLGIINQNGNFYSVVDLSDAKPLSFLEYAKIKDQILTDLYYQENPHLLVFTNEIQRSTPTPTPTNTNTSTSTNTPTPTDTNTPSPTRDPRRDNYSFTSGNAMVTDTSTSTDKKASFPILPFFIMAGLGGVLFITKKKKKGKKK